MRKYVVEGYVLTPEGRHSSRLHIEARSVEDALRIGKDRGLSMPIAWPQFFDWEGEAQYLGYLAAKDRSILARDMREGLFGG